MKKRTSKLMLLGLLMVATVGSGAQAPGQEPGTEGQWGDLRSWPFKGFHMIVLKNGKVLVCAPNAPTSCLLFDPPHCVGGANDTLPCDKDADCSGGLCEETVTTFDGPAIPNFHALISSGHAALADGKIL